MKLTGDPIWIEQELEITRFYCPNCAQQEVWVEASEGDYYQGPTYYCAACRHEFTMPSVPSPMDEIKRFEP
jgi:predicted RNA-binding Zn-ribbon protein involved in translation (DUF1610 family)